MVEVKGLLDLNRPHPCVGARALGDLAKSPEWVLDPGQLRALTPIDSGWGLKPRATLETGGQIQGGRHICDKFKNNYVPLWAGDIQNTKQSIEQERTIKSGTPKSQELLP